jgi:O-antigen/teichoic acid export membrane protein
VQKSITLLVTGVIPFGLLTAVLAPSLIEFLYGAQWAPAAPVLRFLIVLGVIRMLAQLTVDILAGAGATRSALVLNVGWAVALVPALVIGTRLDGIQGAAIAHMVIAVCVALPLSLIALRRVGVDLAPVTSTLVRPVLAGGLAAMVCGIFAQITAGSPLVQLVVSGGSALAVYAALVIPAEYFRRWRGHAVALIPVGSG